MRWWTTDVADGVRLAVAEVGAPAAPAYLVAPGVGSRAELVAACFADPVAALGGRLVTYDPRGHARSTPLPDPADHALDHHARDLAAVAARVGAVVVGGVSLGGWAALRAVAGGLAVEGVVVALPAPLGPGTVTAAVNAATADELARYGVGAVVARVAADPAVPRWVADEVAASWSAHEPASLVAALRAVAAEPGLDPDALAALGAPVGVAAVLDDPAHPATAAADLAARLPRAAVRTTRLADLARSRAPLGAAALAALRATSGPR